MTELIILHDCVIELDFV